MLWGFGWVRCGLKWRGVKFWTEWSDGLTSCLMMVVMRETACRSEERSSGRICSFTRSATMAAASVFVCLCLRIERSVASRPIAFPPAHHNQINARLQPTNQPNPPVLPKQSGGSAGDSGKKSSTVTGAASSSCCARVRPPPPPPSLLLLLVLLLLAVRPVSGRADRRSVRASGSHSRRCSSIETPPLLLPPPPPPPPPGTGSTAASGDSFKGLDWRERTCSVVAISRAIQSSSAEEEEGEAIGRVCVRVPVCVNVWMCGSEVLGLSLFLKTHTACVGFEAHIRAGQAVEPSRFFQRRFGERRTDALHACSHPGVPCTPLRCDSTRLTL